MVDHYRTLVQSLMQLGFLFKRQTETRQELWRNRKTGQDVVFSRRATATSKTAAEAVLALAKGAAVEPPAGKSEGRDKEGPARRAAAPVRKSAAKGAAKSKVTAKSAAGKSTVGKSTVGKPAPGKPALGKSAAGKSATTKTRRKSKTARA
jgi:hypothetical protein